MTSFLRVAAVLGVFAAASGSAFAQTRVVTQTYATAHPWQQDVYVFAPPVMSPILAQRVIYPALPLIRHPERARTMRRLSTLR